MTQSSYCIACGLLNMAHHLKTHSLRVLSIVLFAVLSHRLLATAYGQGVGVEDATKLQQQQRKLPMAEGKDFRWPNRQLNVLVDLRSLNETERQMLAAFFDQIEHKTCIKIKRLSPKIVNPFDNERLRWLPEQERNFIYIFKAQFGLAVRSDHPPLGLSSFGCVNQGRQSMVLGELAFRWPDLVLKYHILRSLGLTNLVRPDQEVRRRLNVLPLSQKIEGASRRSNPSGLDPAPALFAYATFANLATNNNNNNPSDNTTISARQTIVPVKYLSDEDLNSIKQLYNCSEYEQRLSMKPLSELNPTDRLQDGRLEAEANLYSSSSNGGEKVNDTTTTATTPPENPSYTTIAINEITTTTTTHTPAQHGQLIEDVTDRMGQPPKINETIIADAAKSIIMDQLLANDNDKPTTTCSSSGIDENLMDNNKGGKLDIANSNESSTTPMPLGGHCKPLESCPIDSIEPQPQQQQLSDGDARTPATATGQPNHVISLPPLDQEMPSSGSQQAEEMKPMMLKMDEYQAQDPHLQQANQMKLSQLNNGTIETYRLMNSADFTPFMMQQQQQQQQFQLPSQLTTTPASSSSKSEMLISFEQSNNLPPRQSSDPVATLASSQVLKLCSCTCQTMAPVQPSSHPQPLPTATPSKPTTACPTTHDPSPSTINQPLPTTLPRSDEPIITTTTTPMPPAPTKRTTTTEPTSTTTTTTTTTTTKTTTTSTPPTQTEPTGTSLPSVTTSSGDDTTTLEPMPTTTTGTTPSLTTKQTGSGGGSGSMADNPCEQVQWVKPNKTVYASAKIVWDVDRANQNYFLCNNQINNDGELIPGKTHGFSCKVGSEGRAYEMHNFNVLTKPESVNLAWIQRTSSSLGKTNLPVIGGYSKNQDPLVVSRCLVRDENNDIITLIGYINNLGVGLFPFDDIQIECSQYDVLACVS